MLRLYTFDISHFSEKARWALDFEGLDYEEKVLLPGPHQLVTRRIAKRTSVPVLEHDGHIVQGSSAILDYLERALGAGKLAAPSEEAQKQNQELERRVDHAFGLGTQRVLYSAMLRDRKAVTDLWTSNGPRWARWFYALAYPGVATVVARMYGTKDAAKVEKSKREFVAMFDELDPMLQRTPYLGGEAPNRLDITVAALFAPVCRPPEHRVKWPAAPAALADFLQPLEGRPTWQHTLRMYREHRH